MPHGQVTTTPVLDAPSAEPPAPPRPPRRRRRGVGLLGRFSLVAAVVLTGVGGVWAISTAATLPAGPIATDIPDLHIEAAPVAPGSAVPHSIGALPDAAAQAAAQPQAGRSVRDPLGAWIARVATDTGIPARALRAYVNADVVLRQTQPSCHLSWATLAGIGRIESNHGRYGGAVLLDSGRESRPIIGVPLDGSAGVAEIPDSDGGQLDGDPLHDHAVGPMQFIPSTWRHWATTNNPTGRADPQNIDDAALTAARYLCVGGRDMATASGWWNGVLSYNYSADYGQKVFGLADDYAKASTGR